MHLLVAQIKHFFFKDHSKIMPVAVLSPAKTFSKITTTLANKKNVVFSEPSFLADTMEVWHVVPVHFSSLLILCCIF
jgi:hypothetical protein